MIRRRYVGLILVLAVLILPAAAGAELTPEAERHWNQARSLINQGLQSNAIQPLKRAVQVAGDHVPLHCDYQDLMLAQGFSVDLIADYKARRDRSPKEPNWHYLYGRSTGDPALAKVAFDRALQLDPKHKWSTQGLGGVAAVEGRLDEALKQFQAALLIDPAFAQVHNKIAGIHYAQGDYAAAKLAWKSAMEFAPDDHHAYLNMGAVLSLEGDLDGSAKLLREAVRRAPGNPLAYVNLGYVLFKLKRYEESLANFAAALAINPRDRRVAGSRDLVQSVREGEMPFEAFEPYEKALAASNNDPKKAAQHFKEVVLLAPGFAAAHSYLGLTQLKLGEVDTGLASLRKAVQLGPEDPGLLYNLGFALLGTEDYSNAVFHLRRAHKIDGGDVDILSSLALGQLALGDKDAAVRSFGKALEVQPRDPVIWVQLASAQASQGDLSSAAASARKALTLAPGFTTARLQLVAIRQEDRRFDEALVELKPLEKLAPGHPELAQQRSVLEAARDAGAASANKAGNVRLSRIFVLSQETADIVSSKLRTGSSFESLARRYGEGDERSRSGDIGYMAPSSLRSELSSAVGGLKVGEQVGPIDLGGSWVFLKRTD
ncbi:MAG: tetratricopeptide repeat protein [Myxococcota bacterium]|nr:tetratricopeptide repeat protein [Myxococcota bacterium]